MDEGRQGPTRLLPTHRTPQSLLGCQRSWWVVGRPVGKQTCLAGKHGIGTEGASETFDWDFERRQHLYLHTSGCDELVASPSRFPSSSNLQEERGLFFVSELPLQMRALSLLFFPFTTD